MRVGTCALITTIILLYNYQSSCVPFQIGFQDCFYLSFSPLQVMHVLVANSLLFGLHIYEKFIKNKVDLSSYTLKSVLLVLNLSPRGLF